MGSHEAIILHFEKYFNAAEYNDEDKLSKVRKFSSIINSAKQIRVKAEYKDENEINGNTCITMKNYYDNLNKSWSDVDQIIQYNK